MNKEEILKELTCIGCGCTDSNPCKNGCSWIWNRGNLGLCSECLYKWETAAYRGKEINGKSFIEKKVIHAILNQQRNEIIKIVEGLKKLINKKYSTDERRYPCGYNQAIKDIINKLK